MASRRLVRSSTRSKRGRKTVNARYGAAFGKIDRLGERISDGSRDRLQTAYTDRWDYLILNLAGTARPRIIAIAERTSVAWSNAPAREKREPFFFYLRFVPSFVPSSTGHTVVHSLRYSFSIMIVGLLVRWSVLSYFSQLVRFPDNGCCFWRRCCRLAGSFPAGVKAVNWECACNYAT